MRILLVILFLICGLVASPAFAIPYLQPIANEGQLIEISKVWMSGNSSFNLYDKVANSRLNDNELNLVLSIPQYDDFHGLSVNAINKAYGWGKYGHGPNNPSGKDIKSGFEDVPPIPRDNPEIPEPLTMLLFGLGISAIALRKKFTM